MNHCRKTTGFLGCCKKVLSLCLILGLFFTDVGSLLLPQLISKIDRAVAATGDFAVETDSAGGATVSSTGTVYDYVWNNAVNTNANIVKQVNNSDFALSDGGKYLVLYNVWTQEGAASANRRSLNSFLTINGTPTAYGRGGGYNRDSENFTTAYVNGGAIIEASASDNLQIHLQRDDNNTTASSDTVAGTNGVSIVKLPDGADYLRARLAATSSSITGNTTFTDVSFDTADEVDTDSFAFTPTSGNITLKGADGDYFIVTANVGLYDSANSGSRQNYEMRLTLDGTEIPGTVVTEYLRGTNGTWAGQLVYTGLIAKDAAGDQTLNVEVRRESSSNSTTVITGNKTGVTIMAVPNTAEVIRLADSSGTQTTSNSAQALNFNTNIEVDSTSFSHSTTSGSDVVNIDSDGDYLFFATAYSETTTSGNNRQPFRVDWYKTGAQQNRGAFGSFNRANTTFTSGASGAILMSALTTSDTVSLKHLDETSDVPVDNTFAANRVALQGIALNDNFYGLDTIVSVNGSHAANVDVGTTDFYTDGQFVIAEQTGTRNVTNLTITESGTVAGNTGISNVKLFYDLDTSAPYDCASEVYNGGESQFGTTDLNGFSGVDGSSSFTDSVSISTTAALCLYPVLDITDIATDGETIALSINNPLTDVVVTGGAALGPPVALSIGGSVTIQDAELTQIHYHWLNDDGIEGIATSLDGAEDTPAIGFANGTTRRLRVQVSAEGSTSSAPTAFRLEYAQKSTTCEDAVGWTDVGTGGGGDWDMSDTTFFVSDGLDSSDLTVANGGTTNENTTHLTPNGALKDTSSQTGSLIFSSANFLELEYAIEPTIGAPQGNTYCFRVSNAGTELRNYAIYPEGTISADVDVSALGSQVASLDAGTTGQYVGGTFVAARNGANRTLDTITITETGSIDATKLENPTLYYDLVNGDCTTESYAPTDSSVAGSAFSGPNGSTTFSIGVSIRSSLTFCGYLVVDVAASSTDGEIIDIEITDPSVDVVVTASSVGPSTNVSPSGNTLVSGPVLTQIRYHWRNDDGSEALASSASVNTEDTPITSVPKEETRRLRIEVSNEGGVASAATVYRLEYRTKITTCSAGGTWIDVGAVGGAWDMSASANIADGNTTDVSGFNLGEVTNENTGFVGTGALRETTSESGSITLSTIQFTELEYSIEATADSGFGTTYCFRVTDVGAPINAYTVYPELTTRERQDFFVQRGTEDVSGTGITLTAGADYTAPAATSSAFVRITNSQLTGAGNTAGTAGQNTADVMAYISDQSDITSSFTISRPAAATSNTRVSWEIVEFIGQPGTDNEMIVRGTGQLSVSASNLIATGTITDVVSDDADIAVFITGQSSNDAGRNFNEGIYTASWNSAASRAVFERGDAGSSGNVSYAIVEFTGLNWGVQRVEHQYSTSGTPAETESITAIPSVSKGFIHAQKRTGLGLTGLDEIGHQVWLSSLGQVSFQLRNGATTPAEHFSVAWVISNIQNGTGEMNVYRAFATGFTGIAPATGNSISIGGVVNPENASIFPTNDSNGTGTTYPRVMNSYTIASSTDFELWRSDIVQPIDFQVLTVDWPVAETAVRQNYYRLYVDNDAVDPVDPWPLGAADLGENTSLTSTDDPLGEGERIRLRMSLRVNNATLPAGVGAYKLQYGLLDTSCSAVPVWTDIGDPGSGTIWRGYNATPVDGTELATSTPAAGTLNLSVSDVAGTYEEQNNTAVNPYTVDVGEDVEFDWLIEHNGAAQRSDYCFRMVTSDDFELEGYFNYPTIRTTGYTPIIANWRWYDDETNETPVTALGAENVSPSNITNDNIVKLRVTSSEVENSTGTNIKFALQYSEYSDFLDGGIFVTSTTSCVDSSTWCYADGAGIEGDLIQTANLSDADSCVSGVGNGCGTHNEDGASGNSLTQPASSNMEFEFTVQQKAAQVNTVYYFRLYDTQRGEAVSASSSFPNLVTEGARLDFSVSGLPAATSTGGIVTDATTTATSINFDYIPMNTTVEAAQRLTVDTNATYGYQVLKYTSQQLLNSYGDQIEPITSSNASPGSWATACSGLAISCFGYHATDAVLSGGSARFAPTDSYAAISTDPAEVMYNSFPIIDAQDIIYRIQVTEQQPAADYFTDVVYIAVPVY